MMVLFASTPISDSGLSIMTLSAYIPWETRTVSFAAAAEIAAPIVALQPDEGSAFTPQNGRAAVSSSDLFADNDALGVHPLGNQDRIVRRRRGNRGADCRLATRRGIRIHTPRRACRRQDRYSSQDQQPAAVGKAHRTSFRLNHCSSSFVRHRTAPGRTKELEQ